MTDHGGGIPGLRGAEARQVLTVRYFAGARAATGVDEETVVINSPTPTLDEVRAVLAARHGGVLARALPGCSFLLDGMLVRDGPRVLPTGSTLDVLPPFAGG